MLEQFEIGADTGITVVLTTVGIYLTFIVLVRLTGPRSLTGTSSFDVACVHRGLRRRHRAHGVARGAPTLVIGVLALLTFFVLQGGPRRAPPLLADRPSRQRCGSRRPGPGRPAKARAVAPRARDRGRPPQALRHKGLHSLEDAA
ncbi:hypothetical protein JCM10369A_43050 [Nocardioides pyridinolyticus]